MSLSKALPVLLLTITTSLAAQTLFNAKPLEDLGTGTYLGFQGGLYEKGSNAVPADHDQDGQTLMSQIAPINGKIVFLSIGMSNAKYEFGAFLPLAAGSSKVNHSTLAIANGADGDAIACYWGVATGDITMLCPGAIGIQNEYDRVLQTVLQPQGLTEDQVQVAWLYNADPYPTKSLPARNADAYTLERYLGDIARAARTRYPNLKLMFLSSREYAGYATANLNPEPYAYEAGFSSKWLIQAQINQIRTGQIDPIAGDLNYNTGMVPWLVWAAYTWADGPHPRSDGFFWCDGQRQAPCNGQIDVQADGTHPNAVGSHNMAVLQLNYFLTSPYATSWFLAGGQH